MKAIKGTFSIALVAILLGMSLSLVTSAANANNIAPANPEPEVSQEELDKQRETVAKHREEEARIREQYLDSEEDIQHYAYLDIRTAEEELKPIILVARNIIIHRYSWVADGTNGKILDKDGNIKRELPEFSELFPEDWELPVSVANNVDLSYYTAPDN